MLGAHYISIMSLAKIICECSNNQFSIDCKTVGFFFPKIGLDGRVGAAQEQAREPHMPEYVGQVRREKKKATVRFPYNEFILARGSKLSSRCQNSIHNSFLFVNLIHPVIDFVRE